VVVAQFSEYLTTMARPSGGPVAEVAAPEAKEPIRPAGFWVRAVALLIDYGVVEMLAAAVRGGARALWGDGAQSSRVLATAVGAFPALFGVVYMVLFHWLWGQTFGKMALRVRVTTVDGRPLSLGAAVLRGIGFAISVLTVGLGFLMAAVRSDKRALHDLLAGTRVARLEAPGGTLTPTLRHLRGPRNGPRTPPEGERDHEEMKRAPS
jgi:uncharacterized RDD family membrane protein YckC